MRLFICGQKAFGAAAYELARGLGHEVVGVSSPAFTERGDGGDRLRCAAERGRTPWMAAGSLKSATLPGDVDLIVAAHSHDFIGRATRHKARLGAIGYHPSLLPRHRGRDAVKWTIHMRDAIAGGSVYWLSEVVDGGPVAARDFVHVHPRDDAHSLWRDKLFPLGLRLLEATLLDLKAGVIRREPQERGCATWEPSWERAPVERPDLLQIGAPPAGFEIRQTATRG